jgi:hypothetical protein
VNPLPLRDFAASREQTGSFVAPGAMLVAQSPFRGPVSHFTGTPARIFYRAFMLRNIIPLAASLTALFSSLYMYTA